MKSIISVRYLNSFQSKYVRFNIVFTPSLPAVFGVAIAIAPIRSVRSAPGRTSFVRFLDQFACNKGVCSQVGGLTWRRDKGSEGSGVVHPDVRTEGVVGFGKASTVDTSGHVATPGRRLCDWRARLVLGGMGGGLRLCGCRAGGGRGCRLRRGRRGEGFTFLGKCVESQMPRNKCLLKTFKDECLRKTFYK